MIKIEDSALLKLLPFSLRQDPVLVAMAEAVENQFKEAYQEADLLFNLVEIENIPERLLDLLAYEKHVDFYNVNWAIEVKRAVVKASISQHRKKGTPGAVESVVNKTFGDGIVDEWFDYGGRPYYFRVVTEQPLAMDVDIENLTTMINEFKNVRSWLENITVNRKLNLGLNIGGAVSNYQQTKILAPKFEMVDLRANLSYGALIAKYDTTTIETLPFTIADARISKSYGGAFSNYMKTTILSREVI